VLEPQLRKGALILVDDVDLDFGHDVHGPLLAYLADAVNGYLSVKLPSGTAFRSACGSNRRTTGTTR
jgi:hypothetical protein